MKVLRNSESGLRKTKTGAVKKEVILNCDVKYNRLYVSCLSYRLKSLDIFLHLVHLKYPFLYIPFNLRLRWGWTWPKIGFM